MAFSLKSSEYDKLVEICEKLAGSVEPGYRFIKIFFKNEPRFFATDGCAKIELPAGSETGSFDGTYVLPLDYAKALKNQPGEADLEFSFSSETLLLEVNDQKLVVEKAKLPGHPEMERKFEFLFGMPVRAFSKKLDYVSSISNEGDFVEITGSETAVTFVSQASNMTAVAFADVTPKHAFAFSVPYVTTRHLVKTLSLAKTEELSFGTGIADLGLKTGRLLVSLCKLNERRSSPEISRVRGWLKETEQVEKKAISDALRKACRLISKGLNILLISDKKGVRLYLKSANMRYEETFVRKSSCEFFTKVEPHRLRSALARMPGSHILIGKHAGTVIIADRQGGEFILLPEIR